MERERAIEHLLDLHAKGEIRMEKAEARMEQWEARADRADARMDRFDKQLKATANLVRAGMKIVVKNIASHRRLEKRIDRLIDQLQGRSRQRPLLALR